MGFENFSKDVYQCSVDVESVICISIKQSLGTQSRAQYEYKIIDSSAVSLKRKETQQRGCTMGSVHSNLFKNYVLQNVSHVHSVGLCGFGDTTIRKYTSIVR